MKIREVENIFTTVEPVKSLMDYVDAVNYISHHFSDNLWFRGHSKEKYENVPSIYRRETWLDENYKYSHEWEIFKNFKRKCKIHKDTDYEYVHLMQHYGLPTRLLDWTESSFIALFFAIHNLEHCDNPVVWVIEPNDFNKILHKDSTIFYFYGNTVSEKIDGYINPKDNKHENILKHPIAVLPSYYDDRVIAQKSCFTLFGKNQTSIEELAKSLDNYFNIAKIVIDTKAAEQILIDLNMSGIDYTSAFPDLYGLVQETKRIWRVK